MNALLATLQDLGLATVGVCLTAAVLWGLNRWTEGKRYYEEKRDRPEPVEPVNFGAVICEHIALTVRHEEDVDLRRVA